MSHQAGIELVLEAHPDYWRKVPHVKRLVFKSVPEATTRLAMLKKQEADVTYGLYGTLAEEVRRDAHLKLEPVISPGTLWFEFIEQYNPQSPWSDKRVRLAANYAVHRQAINEAETLGYSVLSGNIVPRRFDYALALEPYPYDPQKAKELLKAAGHANGFDAGEVSGDSNFGWMMEAMANDLTAVGIRVKVRPMERAAAFAAHGRRPSKTWRSMAAEPSGTPPHALALLFTARERKHGSRTLSLTPGTNSRQESVTTQSARTCCTKSSRDSTTKRVLCQSGSIASCAPRGHARGVRAEYDSVVFLFWTL